MDEAKHAGCHCNFVLSLQSVPDKIYQIDFFIFKTCRRVAQQCFCVLTLNLAHFFGNAHKLFVSGKGPLIQILSLNLTQGC